MPNGTDMTWSEWTLFLEDLGNEYRDGIIENITYVNRLQHLRFTSFEIEEALNIYKPLSKKDQVLKRVLLYLKRAQMPSKTEREHLLAIVEESLK